MSKEHTTNSSGPSGDFVGPYSATDFGMCQYGHPVNCSGRCSPMNPPPGGTGEGCPPPDEGK